MIYLFFALLYLLHSVYRMPKKYTDLTPLFIDTAVASVLLVCMFVCQIITIIADSHCILAYVNLFLVLFMMYQSHVFTKDWYGRITFKQGFMIGRFQPFHTGHLHIIEEALKTVDKLYVCIGSFTESETKRNPLSGKERYSIMTQILADYIEGNKVVLVPLPDLKGEGNNNPDWGEYVFKTLKGYTNIPPKYTFGGEEVVRDKWYSEEILKNLTVIELPKTDISATIIRENIKKDVDVSEYLPDTNYAHSYERNYKPRIEQKIKTFC